MEGRVKKYMQVSPERAKVWTEKSPKYHYNPQQHQQKKHNHKVPVVYYLCKNRQLEHPHFMEVPLSSSDDLYLRDVIKRLNVLRGRGIASMYSWSCKRNYKNGYVWHDLCDDDIILPAHGNEYVLKGSEPFEESNCGLFGPAGTLVLQNQKALPEQPAFRSQEESLSSFSFNGRTRKSSQDDELSSLQHPCSSAMSPESIVEKNSSWNGSLSLIEYKFYKSDGLADASTQTEEKGNSVVETRDICTRGISTEDGLLEADHRNLVSQVKQTPGICRDFVSPPPSTSSASSLSGRKNTLESLIRDDVNKLNNFRILEEEGSTKLKASNMIMQLISCGSLSVKDHLFGWIPTYKPRFLNSKYPSLFSTPVMLGEIDCLAKNPHLMGMRLGDKEHFSGSLAEISTLKEGVSTLKRSSSYNADRTQQLDCNEDKEESCTRSKCLPRSIKASLSKQPRCESRRSPLSEGSITSSQRVGSSPGTSNGGSKRIAVPLYDKENVIRIEESLLQELGL